MRILPLALILALVVSVAPAAAATKNVKVGDYYYVRSGKPPTVKVKKGTVVKWNFRGREAHNVVAKSGPARFQSALKRTGSFKRKMKKRGTYKIVCTIHPPDMKMTLKVI
jgi:plastocyanin